MGLGAAGAEDSRRRAHRHLLGYRLSASRVDPGRRQIPFPTPYPLPPPEIPPSSPVRYVLPASVDRPASPLPRPLPPPPPPPPLPPPGGSVNGARTPLGALGVYLGDRPSLRIPPAPPLRYIPLPLTPNAYRGHRDERPDRRHVTPHSLNISRIDGSTTTP